MKETLIKHIQINEHILGINDLSEKAENFTFIKLHSRSCYNSNIVIAIVNNINNKPIAIAKIPRNPEDLQIIEREFETIKELKNNISKETIINKIPIETILVKEKYESFLIQQYKQGNKMVKYLNNMSNVERIFPQILTWIFNLYDCEPRKMITAQEFSEIVENLINNFKLKYANIYNNLDNKTIDYLNNYDKNIKIDKISLISQHNDFNVHNIIIKQKANISDNFYVIDWEDFKRYQLPIFDINHFFVSSGNMMPRRKNVDNFDGYFLNNGPYKDLYHNTIRVFEKRGYIGYHDFIRLTPLYFINMCLNVADKHKDEVHTANTWLARFQKYIAYYNL